MVQALRTVAAKKCSTFPPTTGPRQTVRDRGSTLSPTAANTDQYVAAVTPRRRLSSSPTILTTITRRIHGGGGVHAAHRVAQASGNGADWHWTRTGGVRDTRTKKRRSRVARVQLRAWHKGAAAPHAPPKSRSDDWPRHTGD
eukprot:TRINITY_DN516_c0_g1_i11.p3 TRINITY_DN516_c0_g1~~TRINITY_DN516_c0_g1_i11.p3  ORF type:complete len:142 (+),score=9.12 TRINITY_DN516_c0_g1_i11:950-1375(+)